MTRWDDIVGYTALGVSLAFLLWTFLWLIVQEWKEWRHDR